MQSHPSLSLLRQESRTRHGPVPKVIGGNAVPPGHSRLLGDEYLMRPDDALSFYYRRGQGITVERGPGADLEAERLYLNGSVYAAMASINGFMPIHASAVAFGGKAIAFTAPSGGGKSTLVAALGRAGLPMVCDDTLVLEIAGAGAVVALPGHKRLKLLPDALALAGAARQEEVGAETGKFYAAPPGGVWGAPLELGGLVFLEESSDVSFRHITGAERFARLQDDHYTANLFHAAGSYSPERLFALRARLARAIPMACFSRPRDEIRFTEGVAAVMEALPGLASPHGTSFGTGQLR